MEDDVRPDAARGVLPFLRSQAPTGGGTRPVYTHDASPAWGVYLRDGLVPRSLPDAGGEYSGGIERSQLALVIHERHFRRHDLGPAFHEGGFDGRVCREFVTEPLWGVGSTPPYGHDGRSINLREVILRHGGEALESRRAFERLGPVEQHAILAFLESLVLFGPPDTPSNLDPAVPSTPGFPQFGHGSIRLVGLFNDPNDPE